MGKLKWSIPKIWPDSTVFIIGGGPTVKQMDLDLIKKRRCIGVNNAFELGNWVDVCYFGDCRWWEWNKDKLRSYSGLKVTSCNKHIKEGGWPGVNQVRRGKPKGIDLDPRCLAWNRNSGASAINLAYHFGAKTIILLGFDMKVIDGEHNFHDSHKKFHVPPKTIYQKRFLPVFKHIRKDADEIGLSILNASPDSELDDFEKVVFKDVV